MISIDKGDISGSSVWVVGLSSVRVETYIPVAHALYVCHGILSVPDSVLHRVGTRKILSG